MWLGVLFIPGEESDEVDHDQAILLGYGPERPLTTGSPVEMVPKLIEVFFELSQSTGALGPPRCGACDAPLEVPPLEEWEAPCVSA